MYEIRDIETNQIIEVVDTPPESIPYNAVLVEAIADINKDAAILAVNKKIGDEIEKGYTRESDGSHFSLTKEDQLNYTATAAIANMGVDPIKIVGELGDDKYHEFILSNEDAKALLSELFGHVESILTEYRDVKKQILATETDEDIIDLLSQHGIDFIGE